MELSPLVQAVIVYMKDHFPSTPEELNFHAELKAASQWYWLNDRKEPSALKKVPAHDCRLKIAVRDTLGTWEKEEKDLREKLQSTEGSDSSDDSVDEELAGEHGRSLLEHNTGITVVKVHIPSRFEFFEPHLRCGLNSTCRLVITSNLVSMRIGRFCYTS